MLLIADGGSTKTTWVLIDADGSKSTFTTEGYNPYFVDTDYIIKSIKANIPADLDTSAVSEVNYYGAGVHNEEKAMVVQKGLNAIFTNAKATVNHDLLAAARALLGTKPGFAAILGTGTNTCIYDGQQITHQIDSLAYILGDEGSGCYIGKKLISDYVRGYMPADARESFWNTYKMTEDEIIDSVYTKPLVSRFCASFSKFAYDDKVNPTYTRNIVKSSFQDFFKNLVSHYPNYQSITFNCIGGVADSFKEILLEVAEEYGMKVGQILRSPMEGLVKYHQEVLAKG